MVEWCDRVLVLGFNCSRYDESDQSAFRRVVTRPKVKLEKKGNTTMCAKRNGFLFIEIISYLDPGNIYEKWVKAYGYCVERSWFPY